MSPQECRDVEILDLVLRTPSRVGPRIAVKESAAVAWTKYEAGTSMVQAAFRPKDGSFGSPASVLPGGFDPDVAVDEQGNAFMNV